MHGISSLGRITSSRTVVLTSRRSGRASIQLQLLRPRFRGHPRQPQRAVERRSEAHTALHLFRVRDHRGEGLRLPRPVEGRSIYLEEPGRSGVQARLHLELFCDGELGGYCGGIHPGQARPKAWRRDPHEIFTRSVSPSTTTTTRTTASSRSRPPDTTPDNWEKEGAIHHQQDHAPEELGEIQDRKQSRENENAKREQASPANPRDAGLASHDGSRRAARQSVRLRALVVPDGDSRLLHWQRTGSFEEVERVRQEWGVTPRLVMVDAGFNAKGNANIGKDKWESMLDALATGGQPPWRGNQGKLAPRRISPGEWPERPQEVERFYSPVNKVSVDGNRTCRRINFSTLHLKDMFNIIRQNQDPDQGPTWEVYRDVDEYYLRSMDSGSGL